MNERVLLTKALSRVEGEGAMSVTIRGEEVVDVKLRIYEPPRFFEAFLRGRKFTEVPDITARICGICPVAYQVSAVNAMEDACGIDVGDGIRRLRRLLYCGEWIESHTLHVFMLHAPDFLGYPSGLAMARDHREVVERGLAIKKAGNALVRVVGGREIHPINVAVGGFYRPPSPAELAPARAALADCIEPARESVRFLAGLPFPDFEEDYEFVALTDPDGYAIEDGRLASSGGLDLEPAQYPEHFVEEQVPHSTALHSRTTDGRTYMVGPLARYALGGEHLNPLAREAADAAGLGRVVRNPFRSIVVRMVEVLHALEEAVALIDTYEPPDPSRVTVEPRQATGHGWSEAPRGLLYHRYRLDGDGVIEDASIVPPTSQNQRAIETSLYAYVRRSLDLPDDELRHRCEQAIRNYDPCISCSTHFLQLEVDRA
jgi:coenzyme F420-reducing hydrogenase alpha subunit